MDKLFFIRLSDKPNDIVQIDKINPHTRKPETITIFQANGKTFTYTFKQGSTISWIAELGKYDASKVHSYPRTVGNPGGYPVIRIKLVWDHSLKTIREFIDG